MGFWNIGRQESSAMNYLHQELEAGPEDLIDVELDGQANVMLLDPTNFEHYRKGATFRYQGGLARNSPLRLVPPQNGKWHVVVDLGGYGGRVRAGVRVISGVKAGG